MVLQLHRLDRFKSVLCVMGFAVLVSGCSSWMGESEDPPLPGERLAVLSLQSTVEPDPGLTGQKVVLPQPHIQADWPQNGGIPSHSLQHVAFDSASMKEQWSSSIGDGSLDDNMLLNPPVIAKGVVFTIDADADVRAFSAKTGKQVWSVDIAPDEERDSTLLGSGLAYDSGTIYATTGFAEVVAIDAATAAVKWRTTLTAPMRAAPTVKDGRVFVITVDNQTVALNAGSGEVLWNHRGAAEGATFIGGASPAVDQGVVVSAYSTGELYALRVENGQVIWSDTLASAGRTDAVSAIADIRGLPVIDKDLVIATSNSGLTVAIDLRTGVRLWELEEGGIQSPWVAGNYVFLLSNTNDLIALQRRSGRVKWVSTLPRYVDPEDKSEAMVWTGPVLAGDRLIVGNQQGQIETISPYDGKVIGTDSLPGPVTLPPVVAGDMLYFLTANATLVAYR